MVRRRVFSAPPSQRPVVIGGKVVANPTQEIEVLKAQLIALQMATGQASMMEAQLMATMGPQYPQGQGQTDASRKTPWYPQGAPYPTNLSSEIISFTQLVSLDQQEREQRDALILSVASAAIKIWPTSNLAVGGCYATGTSEPAAPLQLVISNCRKLNLQSIESLSIQGHAMSSSLDNKVGTFQIVSSNGIVLKARLFEGHDPERSRRQILTEALNEVPLARTLAILLRHVLYHACATLVGEQPGSLPIDALLGLTMFTCRRSGDDPATALVTFLREFGKEINLKESSIDPRGLTLSKRHPDDQLSVLAPGNSSVNMAKGCTCIRMIKAHLQSFLSALTCYNPATALTPLSTMIAHRPLWRRVNGQQAKMLQDPSTLATVDLSQQLLNTSPSAYSTSTSSAGMTPESPMLTLPDSSFLEFSRTQSLTLPRAHLNPASPQLPSPDIVDLAAQFPTHVSNPKFAALSTSPMMSLANSPAIAELVVRFPFNVSMPDGFFPSQ